MNADPYEGYEEVRVLYRNCKVLKNAVIMQDVEEKFRYRLEG
jgi:hypothetical protein